MKQCKIVLWLLLPANENPSKAVQPTVGTFDHPAARFETRSTLEQLGLLAATTNMSRVPEFSRQRPDLVVVVPFVEAQSLRFSSRRFWSIQRNALQGFARQFEIIDVRSGDRDADGDAIPVRQHAPFGATLGPIRGMGSGFFPRPAGPSSGPHPWSATTRPGLSTPRIRPDPGPRSPRRPRPPATPETAGAPTNSNRCPWHSERSTDSRSAGRTRWRSWHPDRVRGDCGSPANGACAAARAAPSVPTGRREYATCPWAPGGGHAFQSKTSCVMTDCVKISCSFVNLLRHTPRASRHIAILSPAGIGSQGTACSADQPIRTDRRSLGPQATVALPGHDLAANVAPAVSPARTAGQRCRRRRPRSVDR